MALQMLLQVALLDKSPLAHVTLPGLLAAVEHEMMLQVRLFDECFAAEGAGELGQSVQSFKLFVGCLSLLLCRRREDLVLQRKGVGRLHLKRDRIKRIKLVLTNKKLSPSRRSGAPAKMGRPTPPKKRTISRE